MPGPGVIRRAVEPADLDSRAPLQHLHPLDHRTPPHHLEQPPGPVGPDGPPVVGERPQGGRAGLADLQLATPGEQLDRRLGRQRLDRARQAAQPTDQADVGHRLEISGHVALTRPADSASSRGVSGPEVNRTSYILACSSLSPRHLIRLTIDDGDEPGGLFGHDLTL